VSARCNLSSPKMHARSTQHACMRAGSSTEAVVPLACLVYNLKPSILATLLASLLMERRIILLSSSFATMATAVHAAAALLKPFKWHYVFLPLLPADLLDVLCSPTPYLVGMPVMLKDEVDWDVLDEVVIVNLDEDSINPEVGANGSDSDVLPGWQQLVSALSTMQVWPCLPLCTCMHGYRRHDA
jgi:hypothetical protein